MDGAVCDPTRVCMQIPKAEARLTDIDIEELRDAHHRPLGIELQFLGEVNLEHDGADALQELRCSDRRLNQRFPLASLTVKL